MRILTIIDHLGPGGRQRTAQNYAIGYSTAGHSSAVLTVEGGGPREAPLARHGIPAFIAGTDPSPIRSAVKWKPEVLHLHSEGPPKPHVAATVEELLAVLPERVPVLETSSFGKVDYRRRYRATDVHLLKSRWALWRWQRWNSMFSPPPVGVVVPNTVDLECFRPVTGVERSAFRRQHGIPEDAVVFGCIARPDPVKWPPMPFVAFERLTRRHPHAHLLVGGITDAARTRIARMPEHARARITEIPFVTDDAELRRCYSSMDVFLHASRIGESFGLVLIESLACGTPVITLSTPAKNNSQLEVVGHERGGLVTNDLRGMEEAMERMLLDREYRLHLGRVGAAHVRSVYSMDSVLPSLLRIIGHARQAQDPVDLARRLRSDRSLTTSVEDDEIAALMAASIGRLPIRQRILKRLVHVPILFLIWRELQWLKRLLIPTTAR